MDISSGVFVPVSSGVGMKSSSGVRASWSGSEVGGGERVAGGGVGGRFWIGLDWDCSAGCDCDCDCD